MAGCFSHSVAPHGTGAWHHRRRSRFRFPSPFSRSEPLQAKYGKSVAGNRLNMIIWGSSRSQSRQSACSPVPLAARPRPGGSRSPVGNVH